MKEIVAVENDGLTTKLIVIDDETKEMSYHRMPLGIMKLDNVKDYIDKINFESSDKLLISNDS